MEPMAYLETGDDPGTKSRVPSTGAGDNPSTWAGIIVLASLVGLIVIRRGFRNFM